MPSVPEPLLIARKSKAADPMDRGGFAGNAAKRLRLGTSVMMGAWVLVIAITAVLLAANQNPELAYLDQLPMEPDEVQDLFRTNNAIGFVSIAVSVVVYFLAGRPDQSEAQIGDLSLIYGVICAFLLNMAENQLELTEAGVMRGIARASPWVMFFPLLVPTTIPRAATAVVAAALCTPASFFAWAALGRDLPDMFLILVVTVPVLVNAAMAMVPIFVFQAMDRRVVAAVAAAKQMGAYRLEEKLGAGGMGEVWRAGHSFLRRPAAVKLIRPDRLSQGDETVMNALGRFEQEAQVTANLQSPHTVRLFDFGITEDSTLYYVMELLEGIDLETLVARFGPIRPERVVHILRQCCQSLAEAHTLGLVHRDIKPANLILTRYALQSDFVKVLDFGLVKSQAKLPGTDDKLTRDNAVAGTPAYMPPELAKGLPVDGRADLYALGAVAWWLLTGRLVFEADHALQIMMKHVNEMPNRGALQAELDLPAPLTDLILELLAKEPDDRPASATVLDRRLAQIELSRPWTSERADRWWQRHLPELQAQSATEPT